MSVDLSIQSIPEIRSVTIVSVVIVNIYLNITVLFTLMKYL
jgi:hypothetical protein